MTSDMQVVLADLLDVELLDKCNRRISLTGGMP